MAQPPDSWDDETFVTVEKPAATAAAVGTTHACLTVLTGTAAGQMYRIPEGSSVIGRGQHADLRIAEEGVSRRHACVRREGGAVLVDDLGSVNGTYVNGERIGQGKDNTRLYLKEHPEIAAAIDAQLRAKLLTGNAIAGTQRAEEVEEA